MGKVINFNNKYKQMETQSKVAGMRTEEEMRTTNQEGKSQLVENVTDKYEGLSKAFQVMKYDEKYFIGFMGAMVTEPTENVRGLIDKIRNIEEETWDFILNVVTTMIKQRKQLDKLNTKEDEQ